MADIRHTIEVLFQGIDHISGVAGDIGSSIEGVGRGVQDLTAPFADLTKTVLTLETAILTIGVAAGKMASDFKDSEAKISAAFGVSAEEAAKFGEVAKNIFTDVGAVENIGQATDSVIKAYQILGDVGTETLEKMTGQSLKLADIYDADFNKVLDASKTLMEQFGLSSAEAMDFVAGGFQKGLDRSDDFLESITEYSIQFKEGGADAGEFFSVLETGLQGGILGTDKAADAFKEFRIRTTENTDKVQEALAALKIDPEQFKTKDIAEKFNEVQAAMLKLGDSNKQAAVSVELFGVTFEDLGLSAGLAIDTTKTKMSDLQGSIDSIDVDTFSKSFSKAWRTIISEIATLDIWDDFLSQGEAAFSQIAENFPKALKGIDFSEFLGSIETLGGVVQSLLSEMFSGADLTTAEGLQQAIKTVVTAMERLTEVSTGIIDSFRPAVEAFSYLIEKLNETDSATTRSAGEWLGYITQVGLIAGAVAAAGGAIGSLATVVSGASAAVGGLATAFSGPVGLGVAIGAAGYALGSLINQIPHVSEGIQSLIGAMDEFFNLGINPKTNEEIEDINWNFEQAKIKAEEAAEAVKKLPEGITETEDAVKTAIPLLAQLTENIKNIGEESDKLKDIPVTVDTSQFKEKIDEAADLIKQFSEGVIDEIPEDFIVNIDAKVGGELKELDDMQNKLLDVERTTAKINAYKTIGVDIELKGDYQEQADDIDKQLREMETKDRLIKLGLTPEGPEKLKKIQDEISELTKAEHDIKLKLQQSGLDAAAMPSLEIIRKDIKDLTEQEKYISMALDPLSRADVDMFFEEINTLTDQKQQIEFEIANQEETQNKIAELALEREIVFRSTLDKESAAKLKDYIITDVGDYKVINFIPEMDTPKLEKISKSVEKIAPDGKKYIEYVPIVDQKAVDSAKKQLTQDAFADRLLEVTATLNDAGYRADIEKFKNDQDKLKVLEINADLDIADMKKEVDLAEIEADTLKEKFKYTAELNTKKVEQAIEKLKAGAASFESMNETIRSNFKASTDAIVSLLGDTDDAADEVSDSVSSSFVKMKEAAEKQTEEIRADFTEKFSDILNVGSEKIAGLQSSMEAFESLIADLNFSKPAYEISELFSLEPEWDFDAAKKSIADLGDFSGKTAEEIQEALKNAHDNIYKYGKQKLQLLHEEYKNLNDKISEIIKEIEDVTISSEEKIRDIKRQSFTDEELYNDKRLEYAELIAKAVELQAEGSFDEAKAIYDKAISVAESLAGGVTAWGDTDQIAIDLITEASAAKKDLLETQKEILEQERIKLFDDLSETYEELQKFKTLLTDVAETGIIEIKTEIKKAENDLGKIKFMLDQITGKKKIDITISNLDTEIAAISDEFDKMGGVLISDENLNRVKTVGDNFLATGMSFADSVNSVESFDFLKQWQLDKAVKQQLELQRLEFEEQKKINAAKIELLNAQTELLESGEPFKLTVKSDNLKPHLELIWWDILEALQVQVNSEGGLELLGAGI